ncbi:putative transporter, similarity to citrate transporter [Pseudonocardia sp. Ae168_Ps1]|nr:putative transporter, similarity to citrate transporter [Pseudonocardia sp. Ae150A_Ps1]OLL78083.1 putative transporter, similarity to citrate transporter [Pseudonocardia sp. Ae168_Ps1]OLL87793.1 putative transporter, similarity to citrate transporter [Pseudonocardia sp. Ae263_Ps1]OLL92181.1 putative transporter, similarity to citrate transporter [Pseudonocardia sp. Ae356_Ps1]
MRRATAGPPPTRRSTMLAAIGFLTLAVFLAAVLSGRVSVLLALTVVPAAGAVVAGLAGGLGDYVTDGLETVAPVAIMITFAILYFSLMLDSGLFDPAIRRVVRWAGGDPLKICVGTAALTVLVALDGDGASTFLIMVSAMLPLYQRLGMRRIVLAGLVCLGAGVMNMVPWGGPTARAMAALDLDATAVFVPLLPAMDAGIAWVLLAAYLIGRAERRRLGVVELDPADAPGAAAAPVVRSRADRIRFALNVVLTLALVVVLLFQLADLPVVFLCAFVLALLVNRPTWDGQRALFEKHGHNVVLVTAMIFAAGVFTGVLGGTGMITALAESIVSLVPDGAGSLVPVAVAVTSMPLSLVFTPDAYYFGVLPVLAETSAALGGDPAEVARAAVLGQMTTGFPLSPLTASTFILLGMTGVELGRHQRFVFGWAFGTTLVMSVVALATGALTL